MEYKHGDQIKYYDFITIIIETVFFFRYISRGTKHASGIKRYYNLIQNVTDHVVPTGNTCDLYSGYFRFESQPEHPSSWLFPWFYSVSQYQILRLYSDKRDFLHWSIKKIKRMREKSK
jgi:hypothetical protein